jgi:hypothetical protein
VRLQIGLECGGNGEEDYSRCDKVAGIAEKKLFGVPFTVTLSDKTVVSGQVVVLSLMESNAKEMAVESLNTRKPWLTGPEDKRKAVHLDVTKNPPQELTRFVAGGVDSLCALSVLCDSALSLASLSGAHG